ncbi:MAG: carboxypeptidase regulatory-like domain-containing protein, partial [Steroidobacteraceae bacterium]|nr:carboxypeptidase regulatory-like domain-containing protein [Steroidobacteraceae bacterium]
MKRTLGTLSALVLAMRCAFAATPAELSVVAFEGGAPAGALAILVDGQAAGRTDADGAALLTLEAGTHRIELRRGDTAVLRYELRLVEGESAELIATLVPGGEAQVAIESSHSGEASAAAGAAAAALGPPGTLQGRIVNAEDGKPVIGARVFVAGTPIDVRSNENGEFSVPVGAGTYAFSVVAADFATQTIDGVEIVSEKATSRDVQLTPSGLELPEFVVLEPFVEGSLAAFVEERRTTSAVADVLGAEQISRA